MFISQSVQEKKKQIAKEKQHELPASTYYTKDLKLK